MQELCVINYKGTYCWEFIQQNAYYFFFSHIIFICRVKNPRNLCGFSILFVHHWNALFCQKRQRHTSETPSHCLLFKAFICPLFQIKCHLLS